MARLQQARRQLRVAAADLQNAARPRAAQEVTDGALLHREEIATVPPEKRRA